MKLELRRATLQTPGAGHARRSWPTRERLLIRVSESAQSFGVGEATPLPGYSPDTLDDVEAALSRVSVEALREALGGQASGVRRQASVEQLEAVSALVPRSLPAARMGLETAALDYLARRAGVSAPEVLGAAPGTSILLAMLLGAASDPDLLERAAAALRSGFRHLKIKLGAPGRIREEVAGIVTLRNGVGSEVSLRLDANGALSESELAEAWITLKTCAIQLFEEPGALPQALAGEVPLALDESLQGLSETRVAERWQRTNACYLVLKPTALGGLAHCWRLAQRAHGAGVGVVISHCFEGPLAFRAAAALALALPSGLAHGLAPHAGVAGAALPMQAGSLHAWSEPGLGEPDGFE
jgi:L-alanine-DL-glutamate epimerase-like enolase superfamily enzyme